MLINEHLNWWLGQKTSSRHARLASQKVQSRFEMDKDTFANVLVTETVLINIRVLVTRTHYFNEYYGHFGSDYSAYIDYLHAFNHQYHS